MTTERPAFQSIEKSGDFEIRLYAPMIVAETTVEGPLDPRATANPSSRSPQSRAWPPPTQRRAF